MFCGIYINKDSDSVWGINEVTTSCGHLGPDNVFTHYVTVCWH